MRVRARLLSAMLFSSSHVERRTALRSGRPARATLQMGSESELAGLTFVEDGARSALEAENSELRSRIGELEAILERTEGLCEVLDDIDTTTSFWPGFRARASWLVGLLILQSLSSFILAGEQSLLSAHPVVVYFLTMLVGAGGNAGNQSAVRVIRGLAVGAITDESVIQFLRREAYMAVAITTTLVAVGGMRVVLFHGSGIDAAVITLALAIIVSTSILLGATLPLLLNKLKIDAAHAGTSIQVLMDIIGVTVTCYVANAILGASVAT